MQIPLFFYPLIAAVIIGLVKYKSISPNYMRFFIFYLFMSLIVEIIGLITTSYGLRNIWLFNIYTPLEFIFWLFIFYLSIKSDTFKRGILFFIPLYAIATIINQTFIQGFYKFHSITFLIGCFSLIITSAFYLYEIIVRSYEIKVTKNLLFWVSIGLLLFYVADFLYLALFNYLVSEKIEVAKILQKAVRINNLIMYCVFIIGLLWVKRIPK